MAKQHEEEMKREARRIEMIEWEEQKRHEVEAKKY